MRSVNLSVSPDGRGSSCDKPPRIHLRPRCAHLRKRARSFPDGPANRRARADILARVRAENPQDPPGRHPVACVSAIPLGGYVKMAGENAHDGPTGASDEFLSKTKSAALPGARHGAGDESGARRHRVGARAAPRHPGSGVRQRTGRRRFLFRGGRGQGGRHSTRQSHRRRRRRRGPHVGALLNGGSPAGEAPGRARVSIGTGAGSA